MKIKDLQGFPEKKAVKGVIEYGKDVHACGVDDGYNQALSELGELEVELDVEKIIELLMPEFGMAGIMQEAIDRVATAIANSKEVVRIRRTPKEEERNG